MMAPDHRNVFLSRPSAEAPNRALRDGVIDVAPKLTHVEILWIRQRVENRIRFGRIDHDPADVAPEYWRHVHNRLSVGDQPQTYTQTRRHAWLRRQRVMS